MYIPDIILHHKHRSDTILLTAYRRIQIGIENITSFNQHFLPHYHFQNLSSYAHSLGMGRRGHWYLLHTRYSLYMDGHPKA